MITKRGLMFLFVLLLIPLVYADETTHFISVWNTSATSFGSSGANQVHLPLEASGTYDFFVDWGDGTNSTITSWDQAEVTHTYSSPGIYTITIDGVIDGFRFNYEGDVYKLIEISQWGNLRLGDNGAYFYGTENLHITATDILNTSGITNMELAFSFSGVSTIPNMNLWDVSSVTNMELMFDNSIYFNQPLNDWDVSSVTNMDWIFSSAHSFNQPLHNWNVSGLTSMRGLFSDANSFNQNINNWNVSRVTRMDSMFNSAYSFNQPLNNWNVSNVTSMAFMFTYAHSFNQPLNNWNVSNVEQMQYMFNDAYSFNQNINNWNVSKVTNMMFLFFNATSFNQPLNNWDVSQVTRMDSMFRGATSFNQPLNNWNVSLVTQLSGDFGGMFEHASSFNQDLDNWDVSKVTRMERMFSGGSSFNGNISTWDTQNVINMSYMFADASSFNQPLNNWNTSKVTDMKGMFFGANLFDQNLSLWNISSVTDMTDMFVGTDMSVENFDYILISWSSVPMLQHNVVFTTGNVPYCLGGLHRRVLIERFNWILTNSPRVTCTQRPIQFSHTGTNMLLPNETFSYQDSNITFTNSNITFFNSTLHLDNTSFSLSNARIMDSNFSLDVKQSVLDLYTNNTTVLLRTNNSSITYDLIDTFLTFDRLGVGFIRFTNPVTAQGVNLEQIFRLNISEQFDSQQTYPTIFDGTVFSAMVNTTTNPDFNESALISLNVSGWNVTNITLYKDGEICDESICSSVTFTNTTLLFTVNSWSQYDVGATLEATCGNNILEPEFGEVCDGNNFGGLSCSDFGSFNSGSLSCTNRCQTIDFSACTFVAPSGGGGGTTQTSTGNPSGGGAIPQQTLPPVINQTQHLDNDSTASVDDSLVTQDHTVLTDDSHSDVNITDNLTQTHMEEEVSGSIVLWIIGIGVLIGLLLVLVLVLLLPKKEKVVVSQPASSTVTNTDIFVTHNLQRLLTPEWRGFFSRLIVAQKSMEEIHTILMQKNFTHERATDVVTRYYVEEQVEQLLKKDISPEKIYSELSQDATLERYIHFIFANKKRD